MPGNKSLKILHKSQQFLLGDAFKTICVCFKMWIITHPLASCRTRAWRCRLQSRLARTETLLFFHSPRWASSWSETQTQTIETLEAQSELTSHFLNIDTKWHLQPILTQSVTYFQVSYHKTMPKTLLLCYWQSHMETVHTEVWRKICIFSQN